jgi:arginyl-tRNA synthetase
MKAGIRALGHEDKSLEMLIHQMVLPNNGGKPVKMSKRSGEFITLRELYDDVGVDACRFFFASRSPVSHLNFDIEMAKKKSQENPVYYVQYVHARICSIFRNAAGQGVSFSPEEAQACFGVRELCPSERALALKICWFEEVLHSCVRDLSAHHLSGYLLELAGLFHSFYNECRVLDADDVPASQSRLLLCLAVKNTIARGLGLIGVTAPESM